MSRYREDKKEDGLTVFVPQGCVFYVKVFLPVRRVFNVPMNFPVVGHFLLWYRIIRLVFTRLIEMDKGVDDFLSPLISTII